MTAASDDARPASVLAARHGRLCRWPTRWPTRWLTRWLTMAGRDPAEAHRVSTPLELLFDLTFVVAVSRAAAELAHAVAAGHVGTGVTGYLSVFFAIWWAWMNFTWFASAYDSDDVPYRVLTLVQMAGVLVLAAGVPAAFERSDLTGVTVGYVVMRLGLLTQWVRAGLSDPPHRRTAFRYASGIAVLQALWVARLALPVGSVAATAGFLVLVVAELCVPVWSERGAMTTWHPHHIAERYGLFTLIVLGESILAASNAVQPVVGSGGWSASLVVLALSALVLVFGIWWLYFLSSAGEGLDEHPELAFRWGYGHFGVFAGLAALGAGLEVAGQPLTHGHGAVEVAASSTVVACAVAVPVVVVLGLIWALHARLAPSGRLDPLEVALTCAGVLLVALAGGRWVGPTAAVAVMAGCLVLLVARSAGRPVSRSAGTGPG